MSLNSAQLLKQLEPAVRPALAPASGARPNAALESQSFDRLLSLASKGAIHSGRQVSVQFDAVPPLAAAQLERLAAAADQAQAAGAKHALMLIDGRGFVLDVQTRTLTAELSNDPASRSANIDAAIFVPGADQGRLDDALGPPGSGMMPPSLAKQLQSAASRAVH